MTEPTPGNNAESEFPRNWRWDDDGDTLDGTFVDLDEGQTAYGIKPIVVLDVDGENRSVWLLETALRSRFADEAARRPSHEFNVGERIRIRRLDKRTSASGRQYRAFQVVFVDAPKRKAADILGPPDPNEPTSENAEDDGIPF